jgi:hypothetical protein
MPRQRLPAERVDLAKPDRPQAGPLQTQAESADSGKQIEDPHYSHSP